MPTLIDFRAEYGTPYAGLLPQPTMTHRSLIRPGNRRFWPVRCGQVDVDGIHRDRDQLWAEAYQRYRQGGITMCDRWRNSFEAFLADMGERPPETSLDCWPDNNGNYAQRKGKLS